jgi:glycosyltransferase involved in cell wall biosynthesis
MFSIIIPTFNNLEYLKICINSIKKNSKFDHQIIVHVQEGSDGSIDFLKKNNVEFSYSTENIGMPKALNKASKLSKNDYLIISHDDFYFCPNWDIEFKKEIDKQSNINFLLTATMVGLPGVGQVEFDCGNDYEKFDEEKLLSNLNFIKIFDFQGSTKHPALIHKEIWHKVGGWSEEFSPTGGDDTDFLMKLWCENIRIFKGLGSSSVYHFGSITTRKKGKNLFTYLGNKANKIFIRKWGMSINFFEKNYLKSGHDKNKNMIINKFEGSLESPNKDLFFFINLLKFKLYKLYLNIINYK